MTVFNVRLACDASREEGGRMSPCASTRYIKLVAGLFALLLSSTWSKGQSAPPQNPDLQQLKDKLQQLEQTMQELKGQINALEHAQTASVHPAAAPHPTADSPPAAAPVSVSPEALRPAIKAAQAAGDEQPKTTLDLYGFA